MLDPLVSTIEVPCDQQMAFRVFAEDMATWWPLDKRSMSVRHGKKVQSLELEAKLGGQIVERSEDGTEYLWGTYTAFDPHDAVALDFHMGLPPDQASLVEVRFTPRPEGGTRVVLTQSRWEAFGDLAEMMRGGYGSSWSLIFEQGYKTACEAVG